MHGCLFRVYNNIYLSSLIHEQTQNVYGQVLTRAVGFLIQGAPSLRSSLSQILNKYALFISSLSFIV